MCTFPTNGLIISIRSMKPKEKIMNVYTVHGSEDGIIGVYGSYKKSPETGKRVYQWRRPWSWQRHMDHTGRARLARRWSCNWKIYNRMTSLNWLILTTRGLLRSRIWLARQLRWLSWPVDLSRLPWGSLMSENASGLKTQVAQGPP